jgi:hypothetical protein
VLVVAALDARRCELAAHVGAIMIAHVDRQQNSRSWIIPVRLAPGQCRKTRVHYEFFGPPRVTGQGPQGGTSLTGTDAGNLLCSGQWPQFGGKMMMNDDDTQRKDGQTENEAERIAPKKGSAEADDITMGEEAQKHRDKMQNQEKAEGD